MDRHSVLHQQMQGDQVESVWEGQGGRGYLARGAVSNLITDLLFTHKQPALAQLAI